MITDQDAAELRALDLLIDVRRFRDALARLRPLLARNPGEVDVLIRLALCHRAEGENLEAEGAARAALAAAPEDVDALVQFAYAAAANGHPLDALAAARHLVTLRPDSARFEVVHSDIASAARQYEEAWDSARRAAGLDPSRPSVYFSAGRALLGLRRPIDAEEWLLRGLALAPDDADLVNALGVAREHRGELVEAVDLYSRSLFLEPRSAAARDNVVRAGRRVGESRAFLWWIVAICMVGLGALLINPLLGLVVLFAGAFGYDRSVRRRREGSLPVPVADLVRDTDARAAREARSSLVGPWLFVVAGALGTLALLLALGGTQGSSEVSAPVDLRAPVVFGLMALAALAGGLWGRRP